MTFSLTFLSAYYVYLENLPWMFALRLLDVIHSMYNLGSEDFSIDANQEKKIRECWALCVAKHGHWAYGEKVTASWNHKPIF